MLRSNNWIWLLLAAVLLLAPGPAGRFLLDLLGGLTLVVLLLPVLLGVGGFVAWQVIQRQMRTCKVCGLTSMASESCPACGSPLGESSSSSPRADQDADQLDVSQVTIDVQAVDVDPGSADTSN